MDLVHSIKGHIGRWWESGRTSREANAREAARGRAQARHWRDGGPGSFGVWRNAAGALITVSAIVLGLLVAEPAIRWSGVPVPGGEGIFLAPFYTVITFALVIAVIVALTRTVGISITPRWLGLWNNTVARENFASEEWRLHLRWLGWGVVSGLGFLLVMMISNVVFEWLFGSTGHSGSAVAAPSGGSAMITGYAALAVVGAPVVEEVLARGMIYGFLRRWADGLWGSRFVAAAVGAIPSALLFAVGHGFSFNALVVAAFIGGLILAGIYERTGSLWPAIVGHASFNGIGISLVLFYEPLIRGMEAVITAL